ncbi:hypothetical protein AAZX31_13G048400 [Glycine max]
MDLKAEATVGDVEFQAVKIPRQGGYRATYFIFELRRKSSACNLEDSPIRCLNFEAIKTTLSGHVLLICSVHAR